MSGVWVQNETRVDRNACSIPSSILILVLLTMGTSSWCPSLVRQCLKLILSSPQRTTITGQLAVKNTGPFQDRQQASYPSTAKVLEAK